MKSTAIIQARMGSRRLPGKVLADLGGKPVLSWVIDRLKLAKNIDKIVVATTTNPADNAICDLADKHDVRFFRGSEDDVLERYWRAAKRHKADPIIRVCSDCPFIDPVLVDQLIDFFHNKKGNYAGFDGNGRYPWGLGAEVVSFRALEVAFAVADRPECREHVTMFVWKQPRSFFIDKLPLPKLDRSYSNISLTIDYPKDLVFANALVKACKDDEIDSLGGILKAIDRLKDKP